MIVFALFAVASTQSCTCKPPTITALDPASGPPRTVVEVTGTDLVLGSVVWDKGLPGEQLLPTALAGNLFSVPPGATPGVHPVAVSAPGGQTATLNFTVTAAAPFPAPRLDDVTVSFFNIDAGKAGFILFAHGANVDSGAKILVNDVEKPTWLSRVLRPALPTPAVATLGYPVYHYGSLWCLLDGQTPGTTIQIKVKNLDNQVSNAIAYPIAASMDALDSDRDGVPDRIETTGDIDADGTKDIDLEAMGADPLHKDIFLEVDWMNGFAPNANVFTVAVNAMAALPVLNSDGDPGINLIVDRGQGGAFTGGGTVLTARECIAHGGPDNASSSNFNTLKNNTTNFAANRLRIFHYAIFADEDGGCSTCGDGVDQQCSSGRNEVGSAPYLSNDFYVTCSWCANDNASAGTLLHELGHNLNLGHGGNEDRNRKPNYPSIMSYRYQFPGVSTDCDLTADTVYTYSQAMLAQLDENALNEGAGICGNQGINWDGDANPNENPVSADINSDASRDVLRDHADLPFLRLDFTGPGSQWGND